VKCPCCMKFWVNIPIPFTNVIWAFGGRGLGVLQVVYRSHNPMLNFAEHFQCVDVLIRWSHDEVSGRCIEIRFKVRNSPLSAHWLSQHLNLPHRQNFNPILLSSSQSSFGIAEAIVFRFHCIRVLPSVMPFYLSTSNWTKLEYDHFETTESFCESCLFEILEPTESNQHDDTVCREHSSEKCKLNHFWNISWIDTMWNLRRGG
jgi:hypothetical protein